MRRTTSLTFIFALLIAAAAPSSSSAITLVSPTEGETLTTAIPTFSWSRDSGENSSVLEVSLSPELDSYGYFRRTDFFRAFQNGTTTSWSFAPVLFAADDTWYWHVQVDIPSSPYYGWSETRSFFLADHEKPSVSDFDVDYLRCSNKIAFSFEYDDNSTHDDVRWRIDFLRRKGGKPVGHYSGRAYDEGFIYKSRRPPGRLRTGERYPARLTVRDLAGNRTRTGLSRVSLGPC